MASQTIFFHAPAIMLVGGGALSEAANLLKRLGAQQPLIVTDAFMVSSGLIASVVTELTAAGLTPGVFSETVPDPTTDVITAGVSRFQTGGHDALLAIGGGSPMDTAKGITLQAAYDLPLSALKTPFSADRCAAPVICVPTTAGTGSEVTRFCVITDSERDEKMLISGLGALPAAAIIDYELTLTMPRRLTADTGIDALTHAIEAYVSRKANALSDAQALLAMKTLWANLRSVCDEPGNRLAREAMMWGATQAGLAFSNASVALVHGMSRPLGAFFHVPHGLSNAMLLPLVTEFSAPAAPQRYATCARHMGLADDSHSDDQAIARLIAALKTLNQDLEVPTPRAYGIPEDRYHALLPVMSAQALSSGSPANNPRLASMEEIIFLYRCAYG